MDRKQNILVIVKTFLSCIIWGLGQALNKQFGKALFFFSFFVLLVGIELGTSNYFTTIDPYDKIIGKDYSFSLAQDFHETYLYDVRNNKTKRIEEYEAYYDEVTQDGDFTNEELYTYIVNEMSKEELVQGKYYPLTPLANEFKNYLTRIYNKPGNQYNMEDYSRFMVRLHLIEKPEVKEQYEKSFYNFFYDKAGFFVRGIWSIITLGETRDYTFVEHTKYTYLRPATDDGFILTNIPVKGHHSTNLLLTGLISTLILCYFMIIMVWGVKDTYKTAKKLALGEEVIDQKNYFKEIYQSGFEYIVLAPALFIVTIISIMPIIFGFLIAFTNYNEQNFIMVDWVGLANFKSLGKYTNQDIPFGKAFPKVFLWTVIWAIMSTFTCYFAGFFQALILNSKHVVGRKLWRSLLILPWAIPALISQMVLKLMFNDQGVVNTFLRNIGVYEILFDLGMLGKDAHDVSGFWETLTYLGTQNIEWFTNTVNYTFVRAVIIIVNIWLGFPFFMALITGVMTSIDKSLYEAAEIDGASNKAKFRYITFPMILSQTAPLLLMTFSGNFNNFGIIYFVTEGGHGTIDATKAFAGSTDILISWMYRLTVDKQMYNMASVFSIIIFLIIGTISAWNFTRMKAFKED